jgi:hypothetical protein
MDIVTVMDPWQCIKILSPKMECERVTVIHAQVPIVEGDCTIKLMGENQKFLHYTLILHEPPGLCCHTTSITQLVPPARFVRLSQ